MNYKRIILSWDFLVALVFTGLVLLLFPGNVNNALATDLYNVGISVLSIVFSVYFAALAIIISSSDDDFVYFLEERGAYTVIITTFKFSLGILFAALLYSILLYAATSVWTDNGQESQHKGWMIGYAFLFAYSLLAALTTTLDSIIYAQMRTKFLRKTRQKDLQDQGAQINGTPPSKP